MRCLHEASLHDENAFITLTFNEEHLSENGSLVKSHFQRFIKRLREAVSGSQPSAIRYFHCGEYGERLGRPHHHACIFGFGFPDRTLWQVRNNTKLYRSEFLESLWPLGFSSVGDVTFESAAYVARYIMKKITGKAAPAHYGTKLPEYVTMSRRPGIGRGWIDQYSSDVYPLDKVITRGTECKVPKYYDKCFELTSPVEYATIKARRQEVARKNPDNTAQRLLVRETVQKARVTMLKRGLEDAG